MLSLTNYISHLIYKSTGTTNIIRIIEWKNIFKYLELEKGDRVLDVACGGGELSLKMAEKGCEVYGIDISEDAIKRARHLAKREGVISYFEVGRAEKLPYPGEHFDKVIFSSSLEHMEDDITVLKEAGRVLKPIGCLVLTVPSLTNITDNVIKKRHRDIARVVNYYTRDMLREKFEMTGFSMVRSKYLLNSPLTMFFCVLGIRMEWSGLLWAGISPLSFFCLISDRLFSNEDKGYTLIAEGKKDPN